MYFFHTDYVLLKKFNFVLYVDISYWQLQVGPDLPRPDEPQRILIHWPGSWGCSQSRREIIWEGESELLILSEGQYHIFSRPDTFAIEKRLWLMVSFISAVHSKCRVREKEIISQRSVSRQSTNSFYIIFFLFSFYLPEVVAIIMTPIFSSASSTYNLFMWVHTLFNLGAYKY